MNDIATPDHRFGGEDIDGLVRVHKKNGPLQQAFYYSPTVFAADMARIFGRWWLFAGHSCLIPNPGDFFTWKIGNEPVLVVRDDAGEAKAYYNTCRHRGSRICTSEFGHANRLVCPYHRWTYGLDGKLLMNTKTDFGVDRSELSLHPIHIRNAAGLLFISLADDPPSFDHAFAEITRRLKPHGMERAKVAHTIDYTVRANWKIVFENNRECYHCPSNHKEYVRATYDVARDQARTDPSLAPALDAAIAQANARFRALGLDEGDVSSNMTGTFFRAHRTPLVEGYASQSMDGQPLSSLMGDFKEPNAGTLRTTVFPNFWQHSGSDYAAAARITPLGPTTTAIRATWLVDKDAVEGKDYTLDRLLPFWDVTNRQDWTICENQQIGIGSSRYRPGPFSLTKEQNVAHFLEWYLREVSGPGAARKSA
ncbi:MAG: aromatic ring-hydroxylating dioxygenase subunit alpha [Rhodospirillales bacterium]|nr:aromatic ring-hydroxylating dioxygenase subunit alpha [Rhodospirillales bacterium]